MDEKAVMGFVLWLFVCVGLLTVFTVPEKTGQACAGNVLGLAGLIWVLRLPAARRRIAQPNLLGILLLASLLGLGILLALGLGWLARLL